MFDYQRAKPLLSPGGNSPIVHPISVSELDIVSHLPIYGMLSIDIYNRISISDTIGYLYLISNIIFKNNVGLSEEWYPTI